MDSRLRIRRKKEVENEDERFIYYPILSHVWKKQDVNTVIKRSKGSLRNKSITC